MSDAAYAAERIRQVTPREHRSVQDWIRVTARRLGWGVTRTKSIWYGEARRIDAREMRELEHAIEKSALREARRARDDLAERVERLEAIIAAYMAAGRGEDNRRSGREAGRLDRS
ncbi:hypothetical protein CSC94_06005 [Zhengella mangrovi]|uniref:Uncharacterized protein n=2 Tax=Zhengella mangrovi TaxID=1982044 RepID=A0A2G1QRX4_9HYPH|nr:hypothetical protein CSC94_06005 [Zhengella mangrovi]